MRAARELRAHPGEPDVAEVLIQLDRIPDADTAELERLESGVARLLASQPGLASSALGKYAAKQQHQWATLQCSPGKEPKQKPSVAEIKLQLARQWRLYTVYKAVMSDYAAVFSHHRALEGEGKSAAVYGGSAAALHWAHLLTWQKVNHYPHAKHLTRKDFLARSIGRCRHLAATGGGGKHAGSSTSARHVLPAGALVAAHVDKQKRGAKPTWIMKPVGLSRGRGISVVSSIEDVTYADPVVVQAPRPARLLGGHKFDLRLYVLVTSFAPLEAFIYREGFARVATKPFSAPGDDNGDKFVHLTNASIQKHGGQEKGELYGPLAGAGPDEAGGTKCSLDFLWRRLRREDPTFDEARVWGGVRELVLKSLVCVEDAIPHQPNSFELFGYDVLIDADSRCWLIEVNASPSMARETPLDADVKERCIRDVINLVDPVPYDRDALVDVFDKRLKAAETGERLLAAPRGRSATRQRDAPLPRRARAHLAGDLNALLPGAAPRRVGEPPACLGGFEALAPSKQHDRIRRVKACHPPDARVAAPRGRPSWPRCPGGRAAPAAPRVERGHRRRRVDHREAQRGAQAAPGVLGGGGRRQVVLVEEVERRDVPRVLL
ncbi:hypothetical protein JL720_14360 [Aureococcus anophagefferens]|nr:hypothetical protein JL720_14360 [Aureococcus anophagefferens]